MLKSLSVRPFTNLMSFYLFLSF